MQRKGKKRRQQLYCCWLPFGKSLEPSSFFFLHPSSCCVVDQLSRIGQRQSVCCSVREVVAAIRTIIYNGSGGIGFAIYETSAKVIFPQTGSYLRSCFLGTKLCFSSMSKVICINVFCLRRIYQKLKATIRQKRRPKRIPRSSYGKLIYRYFKRQRDTYVPSKTQWYLTICLSTLTLIPSPRTT